MHQGKSTEKLRQDAERFFAVDQRRSKELYGALYDEVLDIVIANCASEGIDHMKTKRQYERLVMGLLPFLREFSSVEDVNARLSDGFTELLGSELEGADVEQKYPSMALDIWKAWERHRDEVLLRVNQRSGRTHGA